MKRFHKDGDFWQDSPVLKLERFTRYNICDGTGLERKNKSSAAETTIDRVKWA